jgi:hypothetical protein
MCVWKPIFRFPLSVAKGEPGPRGEQGTVWHSGTRKPSLPLGKEGDFYLQADGTIWTKQAPIPLAPAAWLLVSSIKGDKGEPGKDGKDGLPGTAGSGSGGSGSGSGSSINESLISGHVNLRV